MQSRLPALLLVLLAAAAPAGAATRNFGIEDFDRIRVDGPFRIRLSTGVAPFAKASGSNAGIDQVNMDVEGRTLIVRSNSSAWGGYPGQETGPVEIAIGTHDLSSAWVNGSGALSIDKVKGLSFDISVQGSGAIDIARADVDQLRVSVAGTASAVLAGRAAKMTAMVRGVSTLDATGLATKDATIGAEGPATVKANVTNSAKIDGTGVATISLTGTPACTAKLAGSASVSGCKQMGSGAY
jgi:hypothetical protein